MVSKLAVRVTQDTHILNITDPDCGTILGFQTNIIRLKDIVITFVQAT